MHVLEHELTENQMEDSVTFNESILRPIYDHNTSSNINNEIHYIIPKLNLIIGVNKKRAVNLDR
jgi:hypothetical protein